MATRPTRLSEFAGQAEALAPLAVAVKAARRRGQPLNHILFEGPPGVGKTTVASSILPTEMETQCIAVVCSAIRDPKDLMPTVATMREGQILFLDEVHALPRQVLELLYSVMEDQKLSVTIGDPPNVQVMTVELPRFTLVAATTREGTLPQPFLDRCSTKVRFSLYDDPSIEEVLRFHLARNRDQLAWDPGVERVLCAACRGTPRWAVKLVSDCCDSVLAHDEDRITAEVASRVLKLHRLTPDGMGPRELEMLRALERAQAPLGLNTLSDIMDAEPETIENTVEPWLILKNYIQRSSRGRSITDDGRSYLKGLS